AGNLGSRSALLPDSQWQARRGLHEFTILVSSSGRLAPELFPLGTACTSAGSSTPGASADERIRASEQRRDLPRAWGRSRVRLWSDARALQGGWRRNRLTILRFGVVGRATADRGRTA